MSSRIEDLEPVTRGMCEAFLEDCAASGEDIGITHTLRTSDEQLHLWAKGRQQQADGTWVVVDKKAVVTKAPPGSSPHEYGCAFDVKFNGRIPYPPVEDPRWGKIGRIGEALGLSWGGPLGVGDRFRWDRPHFERRDWEAVRAAAQRTTT